MQVKMKFIDNKLEKQKDLTKSNPQEAKYQALLEKFKKV